MHRVEQTHFGEGYGNCMQASLASIFDLELDEVPNFCVDYKDWEGAFNEWLKARGLFAFDLSVNPDFTSELMAGRHNSILKSPVLLSGKNDKGCQHACVWSDGSLWDPNPSRKGIEEIEIVTLFCALKPDSEPRSVTNSVERDVYVWTFYDETVKEMVSIVPSLGVVCQGDEDSIRENTEEAIEMLVLGDLGRAWNPFDRPSLPLELPEEFTKESLLISATAERVDMKWGEV